MTTETQRSDSSIGKSSNGSSVGAGTQKAESTTQMTLQEVMAQVSGIQGGNAGTLNPGGQIQYVDMDGRYKLGGVYILGETGTLDDAPGSTDTAIDGAASGEGREVQEAGAGPVTVNVGESGSDAASTGGSGAEGAVVNVAGGLWQTADAQPVSASELGASPKIEHPELIGRSVTFARGLAAGASAQQLLGENPSGNAVAAMEDAYELLGISNRQITAYTKAREVYLSEFEATPANEALYDAGKANLEAAVRMRAAADDDAAASLLDQPYGGDPSPSLPAALSADGARSAVEQGMMQAKGASEVTNATWRKADELLFGRDQFPFEGVFHGRSHEAVNKGAQQGRLSFARTDVTSPSESLHTNVTEPPLLPNSQMAAIAEQQMSGFLKAAREAEDGSDLKIVSNLFEALSLQKTHPDIAAHVDVPKIQAQLQKYLQKPEVAALLESQRNAAIETVTGKTAEEVIGGLGDYVATLPKQAGYLALLEADPQAAGDLVGSALRQLDHLDPTAALEAQSRYQQALFSGENGRRILSEASAENRDLAVEATLQAFGLTDGTNAVQKTRFATSGVNAILKGSAAIPASENYQAAEAALNLILDTAAEGGHGSASELESAVMAAARAQFKADTTTGERALGMVRKLFRSGNIGGIASVLSAAAFGMEVSSATTAQERLSTAGDFLLAVGNFPALVTAAGQIPAEAIQGMVARATPALARMGLAIPVALGLFTTSYGVAAYQSAREGDKVSAGLEGAASGVVGIATIVNMPAFGKGVVDSALALGRSAGLGVEAAQVVGEAEGLQLTGLGAAAAAEAEAAGSVAAALGEEAALAGAGAAVAEGAVAGAGSASTWDWIFGPVGAPIITGAALVLGAGLGFASYYTTEAFNDRKARAEAETLLKTGVGDGESYYVP